MINNVWHPGYISALETSTGNVKWEFEISPPLAGDGKDHIGEIYSDKNDMIIFSYRRSGNWYLSGYKDRGTYAQALWDVEYGGKIAFGSGEIYLIPPAYNASIYALSTGESGDPDGIGMGYVNNNQPAQPSDPTPLIQEKDVQTNLTLSWSCSDKDEKQVLTYDVFLGDVTELMVLIAEGISKTEFTPEGLIEGKTYVWKIIASDGQAKTSGPTWSFTTVDFPEPFVEEELHREFALTKNYPNPFNPTTTISYEIPKTSFVTLSIYNIIGQEVNILVNQYVQSGRYNITWDGNDKEGNTVTSGIYFYKIKAGNYEKTRKMMLIR